MDPRYPLGKFEMPSEVTPARRKQAIDEIASTPAKMRAAVKGLSDAQLDTPYRPGGWSVRQVVHHVPDSHMNSFIRFRLALTEDSPTIKPYDEARWAELADARLPIEPSLRLLEALHERWVPLLHSLAPTDWKRTFRHPELGLVSLENNAALYAWHSRHHVAHITSLRQRMNW